MRRYRSKQRRREILKDEALSTYDYDILAAHEARKMNLRLKGTSLADLARQTGLSKTTMSWVSLRKLSVPLAEAAIAEALGKPVEEVFPPLERREDKK